MVELQNKRRKKEHNFKLQLKFLALYHMVKAFLNHIYLIERSEYTF